MTEAASSGDQDGSQRGLLEATKVIPSVGLLAILWGIALRQLFDNWYLVEGLAGPELESLTVILSVPLGLVTYFLGNVWDDRVFDPLYTVDPERGFRGKWLQTSRRNLMGLFPAGNDLRDQRTKAQKAMQLPTATGVYGASRQRLIDVGQWTTLKRMLILSKLCRSLIWPALLVGAGLLTNVLWVLPRRGEVDSANLVGGCLFVLLGLLLFVPYLNLRVEHMDLLYRRASANPKQGAA